LQYQPRWQEALVLLPMREALAYGDRRSAHGWAMEEASLGKIPLFYYTGPFEDMRLQGK
jgi:hypothetical protein